MLKGGYQIIDFKNKNHELGVGVVHEGIYDKIEGTRKTFVLSGIVLDGREAHDIVCSPSLVGSAFIFADVLPVSENSVAHIIIKVEDTDVVTFTVVE